jgi:hypothetical protein
VSARLEFYSSDGTTPANLIIGNQQAGAIYPDLDAIILQFGFRFGR